MSYISTVERGVAIANMVPTQDLINMQQVMEGEIALYNDRLSMYHTALKCRQEGEGGASAVRGIVSGETEAGLSAWISEGEYGRLATLSRGEIERYLGLDAYEKPIPPLLLRDIPTSDDTTRGNAQTIPLEIMYHQLQAVGYIMKRMQTMPTDKRSFPEQPELAVATESQVPQALAEQWSLVPGILLADDVGLGKTLTCLTLIATLDHLITRNPVSDIPCMRGTWRHSVADVRG
jgi:SNF2-related domain